MSSPYITQALERAALPIEVEFNPCGDGCFIVEGRAAGPVWRTSAEATRAYFDLVSTLDPGTSSPTGETAADCSAPSPGCV